MTLRRTIAILAVSLPLILGAALPIQAKKPKKETATAETPGAKGRFLAPAEILKRLETSKIKYTISALTDLKDVTPDRFAELFWPLGVEPVPNPVQRSEADGSLRLTTYSVAKEASTALDQGEAAFEAKHYDQAAAAYRDVIEKYPSYYLAHLYLGDAYFALARYDEALECYKKGIELNPWDCAGFFFQGHALQRLGRFNEARDAWIRALALRPNQASVLNLLRAHADDLDVDLDDSRFEPRAFVRREGDGIAIYIPTGAAHWIPWAACKALWLGEPSYRREKGLSDRAGAWSTEEDQECLLNLVSSYTAMREDGTSARDPELDRLVRIAEDGRLGGFVLYELGSRIAPDVTLLVPSGVESVTDYVSRYVVMSRTSGAPKP